MNTGKAQVKTKLKKGEAKPENPKLCFEHRVVERTIKLSF